MPKSVKKSPFDQHNEEILTTYSNAVSKPEKAWIDVFLNAIMQGSSVTDATKIAGVDITLPYKTRMTDEAFRRAWTESSEIGTEFLEQEAARRAYHGTLKPVFHKGVECGFIREYSDTLMIFLLKARNPEKYRDGVEGKDAGPTAININVVTVETPQQVIDVEVVPSGDGE